MEAKSISEVLEDDDSSGDDKLSAEAREIKIKKMVTSKIVRKISKHLHTKSSPTNMPATEDRYSANRDHRHITAGSGWSPSYITFTIVV